MVQQFVAYSAADLKMVDDHIALGERHVKQQEELLNRLRRHGLPTQFAEGLLEEFRVTLLQHRQDREIMLRDVRPI